MSHLSSLLVRAEIFVVYLGAHDSPVLHHSAHRQAADFLEPRDALDDFDHGCVVAERVAINAHETKFFCKLNTFVHTEGTETATPLVFLHDDEGISHLATPGVFADGQDESSHHLPRVFVHHGKLETIADVLQKFFLICILVSAEALPRLGGLLNEDVRLVYLQLSHGIHDHVTPIHQSCGVRHHRSRHLGVLLEQHCQCVVYGVPVPGKIQ